MIEVLGKSTVSDLIKSISEKHHRDDLIACWAEDALIDNDIEINELDPTYIFLYFTDNDREFETNEYKKLYDKWRKIYEQSYRPVLQTNVINENITKKQKFQVYTTISIDSMLNGFEIELDITKERKDIKEMILERIGADNEMNLELYLFLPGGIPFNFGTIEEYHLKTCFMKNNLYVVVVRKMELNLFEEHEPFPISNELIQYLLSPLYKSTIEGLSQISCLIGYLLHNGSLSESFLLSIAKYTRFAPIIYEIYREFFIESKLSCLSILTLSATLHTFFGSLIPSIEKDRIFEYSLKCSSYICQLDKGEQLMIKVVDNEQGSDGFVQYCKEYKQKYPAIFWLEDFRNDGQNYKGLNLIAPEFDKINNIFEHCSYFRPIPPLSLRQAIMPTIFVIENDICLFLQQSSKDKEKIHYINPRIGLLEQSYDDFAVDVEDDKASDMLIEPESLQIITMLLFDLSTSMNWSLNGRRTNNNDKRRIKLGKECIEILIERIKDFRIAGVYGIIGFNDKIDTIQPLTPVISKMQKSLEELSEDKLQGETHLYKAINQAVEEIQAFDLSNGKAKYPNAKKRIIIIGDGEDSTKNIALYNEIKDKLCKLGIIVDAMIVNSVVNSISELITLCKETGGMAFQMNNNDYSLFEHESFLNLNLRASFKFNENDVSFNTINDIKSVFADDLIFPNKVSTPRHVLMNNNQSSSLREQRIKFELSKFIKENERDDIVIFIPRDDTDNFIYDKWYVMIHGPDETPLNKWWRLYISFDMLYPYTPPQIRFLDVPYHPNISSEGRILFKEIDMNYRQYLSLNEILKATLGTLIEPVPTFNLCKDATDEYFKDNKAQFLEAQKIVNQEKGIGNLEEFIQTLDIHDVENNDEDEDDIDSLLLTSQIRPRPQVNIPNDTKIPDF